MANLIDKDDIRAVAQAVEELKEPKEFILKVPFPNIEEFTSTTIDYDLYANDQKVLSYVRRAQEGQWVDKQPLQTNSVTPPYLKPKTVIRPEDILKRMPGEILHSGSENRSRIVQEFIAKELAELDRKIRRTEVLQARQALLEGKVTAKDADGNTLYEVDYDRHTSLDTAAVSTLWSASGADPLNDVDALSQLIQKHCGSPATDVILGQGASQWFRNLTIVQQALSRDWSDRGRIGNAEGPDGAKWVGMADGIDYWRLDDYYYDTTTGTLKPIIPSNTIIVFSRLAPGSRYYGGISNMSGVGTPAARYMTDWVQEDPSGHVIQLHSAPLVVPNHKNFAAVRTVLS
jgi:hypothetical protein